MITPSVDLFRIVASGEVEWIEAVKSLETAKANIEDLEKVAPGDYMMRERKTGRRICLKKGHWEL